MKHIIPLCGVEDSGKTNTIKSLFGFEGDRWARNRLLKKKVDGKIVYAVGANSPQELSKGRSNIDLSDIKARIEEVLKICEEEANGKDYVLILPFTIYWARNRNKFNESSITEPIAWLKKKGYEVTPVYLQRENYRRNELLDSFIAREITQETIVSNMEYCRQSRALEDIIRNLKD
jgi:hypothetical protein